LNTFGAHYETIERSALHPKGIGILRGTAIAQISPNPWERMRITRWEWHIGIRGMKYKDSAFTIEQYNEMFKRKYGRDPVYLNAYGTAAGDCWNKL